MSITTIANRYGRALADIVMAKNEHAQVQAEVTTFAAMFRENIELHEVFSNPTVNGQQQRNLLEALIAHTKPSITTTNFLKVLLQHYRLAYLPEISQAFARILDERLNIVSAKITTATTITEQQQQVLATQLGKVTGKKVRLAFSTDPSIIGGAVTQVGSQIFDGSIRNHLDQVRVKLRKA